jgi:hypothetical protein
MRKSTRTVAVPLDIPAGIAGMVMLSKFTLPGILLLMTLGFVLCGHQTWQALTEKRIL